MELHTYKGLPKGYTAMTRYTTNGIVTHITASNKNRTAYFLYLLQPIDTEKKIYSIKSQIMKSLTPVKFDNIIDKLRVHKGVPINAEE